MVTAEIAMNLLVISLLAAVGAWVVSLVLVQSACGDVAAQVARQVARGDQAEARKAADHAPRGAHVETTTAGGDVTVTVSVDRSLGRIGPVHLRGQAVIAVEPGEAK